MVATAQEFSALPEVLSSLGKVLLTSDPPWSDLRSALISVLLAVSSSYLVLSGKQRSLRQFWQLSPKGGNLRIVVGEVSDAPHPRGYRYTTVSAGDAEAASLLTGSVALGYSNKYNIRCLPSGQFHDEFWNNPVILVGGGTRNLKTGLYLRDLQHDYEIPFRIEDADPTCPRRIVNTCTGETFQANLDGKEVGNQYDYGVLTRGPNMRTRHARDCHVVAYGLHAFGTLGVAQTLSKDSLKATFATIKSKLGAEGGRPGFRREPLFFQALIRIRVWDDDVRAEIIDARPLLRRPPK